MSNQNGAYRSTRLYVRCDDTESSESSEEPDAFDDSDEFVISEGHKDSEDSEDFDIQMMEKIVATPAQPNLKVEPIFHLSQWKATDVFKLLINITQTSVENIFVGVKFSGKFTLAEIKEFWERFYFEADFTERSFVKLEKVEPRIYSLIQKNALLSKQEELQLIDIPSYTKPTFVYMQELLQQKPNAFHFFRTPYTLLCKWQSFRDLGLLIDQRSATFGPQNVEHAINENYQNNSAIQQELQREMLVEQRHDIERIRYLEEKSGNIAEILHLFYPGLAESYAGNIGYATLVNDSAVYKMMSREIILGRNNKHFTVDIDLSLAGCAAMVSRRHACIQLRSTGIFTIANLSSNAIFVNHRILRRNEGAQLDDESVITIGKISLIFRTNEKAVQEVCNE